MISMLRKGVDNEHFVDNNSSCCVFTVERSSSDCQRDATANFAWFRVSSNTPVYYFLLQLLHLLRTLLGIGSTNNFFEEQIVFRLCTTKADFEFKTPPKLEPSTCLSACWQVVKVSNHRSTILKPAPELQQTTCRIKALNHYVGLWFRYTQCFKTWQGWLETFRLPCNNLKQSKPAWTVRKYVSGPTCLRVSCSTGSGANSARQQYTNVSSSRSPDSKNEVKEAFMRKNTPKAEIINDNPATVERDKN